MFDSLFGSAMPLPAKFFIAFLIVLGLIALTAWVVRRYGADRIGAGAARGRQPRLAVIDAASIDGRRRLVLIRRDNTEHLLMIGGPTDVVVEPNIVRSVGAREIARETTRAAAAEGNSWPLQPAPEPTAAPTPAPTARSNRSILADEATPPQSEPIIRPRSSSSSLTGLAAELSSRLNPPSDFGTPAARPSPASNLTRAEQAAAEQDSNLAEMAQRLEAALRNPMQGDGRPPVTDALAMPQPDQAPARPKFLDNGRGPAGDPNAVRVDPKVAAKHLYDNLEQEMASLLGRPSGKT